MLLILDYKSGQPQRICKGRIGFIGFSTGRNDYGALPVEGNLMDEGLTEVGNRSLRFLVVLSAFFLRLTIDGTHDASGIFEGKINKELGLKTYQIVTVG